MRIFTVALLSLGTAYGETALEAVKELPKEQAGRIAKIEARGGTPDPDRWYILTQDPKVDNGVHEFVVSNGEIVASRSISQFAESLKADDMLGDQPLKIDSDKAAKVARAYAEANGAAVTGMNYELKKDGPDAAPAWTIWCVDDKGNKVGSVVVTAGKGNVVAHDGFALEPEPEATPGETPHRKQAPRFETYAKPDVGPGIAETTGTSGDTDVEPGTKGAHHHHKAQPKKPENKIAKAFQNVGQTLRKINPF
jgi:hypothetical protein